MLLFNCDKRSCRPHRCGLTLLELIVALGVLAVLSTMAVRSLDPLADQARYEATQRLLSDLRTAAVGDPTLKQVDGQRVISGFLADTGSTPSNLADFTSKPPGLVDYGPHSFDSDRDSVNDVTISSGWQGPYIQLGVGQSSIVDGWGHAPLIVHGSGEFEFKSLGADNDSAAPENGYLADVSVTIRATDYTASVVFRLFAIDGTTGTRIDPAPTGLEQLGVLLYRINGSGGTTGAIEEVLLPVAATGTFEVSQADVIHGMAAARGVLWLDADSDDQFDVGETLVHSSYVHYFTVIGGIDSRLEMELR